MSTLSAGGLGQIHQNTGRFAGLRSRPSGQIHLVPMKGKPTIPLDLIPKFKCALGLGLSQIHQITGRFAGLRSRPSASAKYTYPDEWKTYNSPKLDSKIHEYALGRRPRPNTPEYWQVWGDYALGLRPRPNTPGTHRVKIFKII